MRLSDQTRRGLIETVPCESLECRLDLAVRKQARQAVGAEQENVSGLNGPVQDIGLDRHRGPIDEVSQRVLPGG